MSQAAPQSVYLPALIRAHSHDNPPLLTLFNRQSAWLHPSACLPYTAVVMLLRDPPTTSWTTRSVPSSQRGAHISVKLVTFNELEEQSQTPWLFRIGLTLPLFHESLPNLHVALQMLARHKLSPDAITDHALRAWQQSQMLNATKVSEQEKAIYALDAALPLLRLLLVAAEPDVALTPQNFPLSTKQVLRDIWALKRDSQHPFHRATQHIGDLVKAIFQTIEPIERLQHLIEDADPQLPQLHSCTQQLLAQMQRLTDTPAMSALSHLLVQRLDNAPGRTSIDDNTYLTGMDFIRDHILYRRRIDLQRLRQLLQPNGVAQAFSLASSN